MTGGRAPGLGRHLARLDGSTWRLFGKHLPPSLQADLASCLSNGPSGRLRLAARPVGGPLQVTVEVIPASDPPETVALRPVTIAGGLGPHKWLDRRLLAHLAGEAGPGPDEQLLITDRDGEVLETDRASVFAVIDGVLHTPPAGGRLLPGVTRAAVLRSPGRRASRSAKHRCASGGCWTPAKCSSPTPSRASCRSGPWPAPIPAAPFRLAPFRLAPFRLAPFRLAPFRLAPLQQAPLRVAPLQTALLRPATWRPGWPGRSPAASRRRSPAGRPTRRLRWPGRCLPGGPDGLDGEPGRRGPPSDRPDRQLRLVHL